MKPTTTAQMEESVSNERAVSPVIGVILMVAITVVLAATMGTFVLDLGSGVESTPLVSFQFEYNAAANDDTGELSIVHNGGDRVLADRLLVQSTVPFNNTTSAGSWTSEARWSAISDSATGSSTITAGKYIAINGSGGTNLDAATIHIVYQNDAGTRSAILATWDGPAA